MEPQHARSIHLPFGPDTSVIRDSLYSRVPVNEHVLAVMATPEYLRLQRVKQLGWVFTVWPGATHTRYEHSLGVYHLARRALESLLALGALPTATDAELRVFLAAALLHDVGHYPYSHGIEELGPPVEPHERAGIRLIDGPNLSATLERWGVDPSEVAQLMRPVVGRDAPSGNARVYRALLSGALDVDKLDYLPRDARACNVPYGGVDVERLLDSLRVLDSPDGPTLALTEKGISPLHSLVLARQEMFDNVYWHHTNRACMAMLLRAVQDALEAGALRAHELTGQDDASLLVLLSSRTMPPSTRALIGSLSVRRVHKRALELATRSGPVFEKVDALFYDPAGRKQLELRLCTAVAEATGLHVAAHELLLDIPKPEKWEVDVLVRYERPPVGMERVMSWQEATGMTGADLAAYEAHQRRIRLVTSARLRDHVWELRDSTIIPTLLAASTQERG
ncbi:MAG: HD domain-containing protein [Chloroflexia bacterium]|nr:HD domain-containing protein [Chloroflexia bacterium]